MGGLATPARLQWGERERRWLRHARKERGHSQEDCARALESLGGPRVSQPTLAQWEKGTVSRPKDEAAIAAIAQYCADVPEPPPEAPEPSASRNADGVGGGGAFEHVISSVTGERALSDRQAALVDGVIEHLRAVGQPYSAYDEAALRVVASVLGLAEHFITPQEWV